MALRCPKCKHREMIATDSTKTVFRCMNCGIRFRPHFLNPDEFAKLDARMKADKQYAQHLLDKKREDLHIS